MGRKLECASLLQAPPTAAVPGDYADPEVDSVRLPPNVPAGASLLYHMPPGQPIAASNRRVRKRAATDASSFIVWHLPSAPYVGGRSKYPWQLMGEERCESFPDARKKAAKRRTEPGWPFPHLRAAVVVQRPPVTSLVCLMVPLKPITECCPCR